MIELLKGLAEAWNAIPNQEKKLILMWLTTLVLGFVSIGVGIFQGDFLLIFAGIASVGYAVSLLLIFGLALAGLVVWLIVSLLKLPFLLLRTLAARRRKTDGRGEGDSSEDLAASVEGPRDHVAEKKMRSTSGVLIFIIWMVLVGSQTYLLLQHL